MNTNDSDVGSGPREDKAGKRTFSRKGFLAILSTYAWISGTILALIGAVRSAVPSVLPDPSKQFKIGRANDYAPGFTRHYADENVMVFCDSEGLYAISTICTHLGCVVQRNESGFQCPCHGSRFDRDGKVLKGPAPRALDWYVIGRLPGGKLTVDRSRPVVPGTKVKVGGPDA